MRVVPPAAESSAPVVLAAWLYAAAVVVFAALPTRGALDATVGERQTTVTLVAHFAEFVVLAVLVTAAASRRGGRRRALLVALGVGTALALGTELLQVALPWRSFEVRDLALDLLGLGVGLSLVSLRRAAARAAAARRA